MDPPAPATYFDHVDRERTVRSHEGAGRSLARHFKSFAFTFCLCLAAYLLYAFSGLLSLAPTTGRIVDSQLQSRVQILRDDRGVPHLRARSEHDLFFAEGFAQASDRLVQMDLLRRYVYGRISEIIGPIQLRSDEEMRYLDAADIVDRQWQHLSSGDRAALEAFSDGVNAAMRSQPVPFEFRFFLYQPEPWTPKDSLAVTLGVCASLDDSAANVIARDAIWRRGSAAFDAALPLSDASYDVSIAGRRSNAAGTAPARDVARVAGHPPIRRSGRGSNAWAAGAARTRAHRALVANDPHLDLSIPGIWYLVEMRSPGLHVAGATIPGVPGVILGHNERVAWATTNAMGASVMVFRAKTLERRYWKREVFHVRLSRDAVKEYYRAPRELGVPADRDGGIALARWAPYTSLRSPLSTVLELNRASDARAALRSLSTYSGPAQNFLVADVSGVAAYHLAGPVWNDAAWGRFVHPSGDLVRRYAPVPFDRLPSATPDRAAVLMSANNKMYGAGYPYRLSPEFAPPYRAYRIAQLLERGKPYDAGFFARMQLDVVSPADADVAHRIVAYDASHGNALTPAMQRALRNWNGSYDESSAAASLEYAVRARLEAGGLSPYEPFRLVRERRPSPEIEYALHDLSDDVLRPWGETGAVGVNHPMGSGVLAFLNGARLPGNGNEYTIRVQTSTLAQSFRGVWDVGNWDAGGITIPSGESGERRSPHYADQSADWIAGRLVRLPFSDSAVRASTRETLILDPK